MTGIGIGLGLAFGRSRTVPTLTPQQIASLLTAPTEKVHLFLVGDSRLSSQEKQLCLAPEIPWIGAVNWGTLTVGDVAGVYNTEGVATTGGAAVASPLIGGDFTWFPQAGLETEFLGGGTGATVLNTRLATCGITTAAFPLVFASFPGYPVRVRTILHRHAGAPTALPGVRVQVGADYGAGFAAPNAFGDYVFDTTGDGYVEAHAELPADFDWVTYPDIGQDLVVKPSTATTNGEKLAFHQLWCEAERAGVVAFSLAVSGSGIERWIDDSLTPLSVWSGYVRAIATKPVFLIDLGTNNGFGNTQAQHEAKLEQLITRIRGANPSAPIILNTAYPTATDGATTYYRDAAIAVAARVPNTMLVDTHPMWSYAAADAAGHMGDVTHYTTSGATAFFARWADAVDLTANPPGRADFTELTPGIGPATLPGNMVVTSGVAANRTIQTGTSTMVSAVTQNRARVGKHADAHATGVLLEGARSNGFGAGFQAGSLETYTSSTGLVGPDGAGDASRYQVLEDGYSRYKTLGPVANSDYCCSQWERAFAGTTLAQISSHNAASGGSLTTAWTRRKIRNVTGTVARALVMADGRSGLAAGGIAKGARDVCALYQQIEDGSYPTDYIPAGQTRDAETLAFPHVLQAYLVTGRLHLGIRHRPLAAPAQYAGTPILWYSDANNRAYFTPATGVVTVIIAGASYSTAAGASWAAGDTVEWYLACAGGVGAENTIVKYRVNGGAVTAWNSAAPQGGISATPLYVASGTADVFASFVESVDIGVVPAWAA